jgi:hypothetical protein
VSVKAAKASLNIHLAEEVYVIPGPDRIELLHRIAEIAAMRVRDAAGLSHEVSFVPALNPLEMIPVIHELDGLRA